jgi:hypothetical protein
VLPFDETYYADGGETKSNVIRRVFFIIVNGDFVDYALGLNDFLFMRLLYLS